MVINQKYFVSIQQRRPMQTTLASTTGDSLLTPGEITNMRKTVTVEVHVFKGLNNQQRSEKFAEVKTAWEQFKDVCQTKVASSHIDDIRTATEGEAPHNLSCDYMIVISCGRYVLGFAMTAEETTEYDDATRTLLALDHNKRNFETNKTLHIKLLCARKSSGVGGQLLRVCENLAISKRCASVHLDAVTTAYGFYKNQGFAPFHRVTFACSPGLENKDAEKFEEAIKAMERSFESSAKRVKMPSEARLRGKYNAYMNKTSNAKRAVLSGVLLSRLVPQETVYSWALQETKLGKELKKIVDTVFTTNNVYSQEIPMTKCVLDKSVGGGGGGGGGGYGGYGGYGGGGSGSGGHGGDSDQSTVEELAGSGSGDGGASDQSTVEELAGSGSGATIGQKRGAPDSDSSGSRDY